MNSRFQAVVQASLIALTLAVDARQARAQYPAVPGAAPAMPASPLAGGPAAAAGGQFMDAYGNPVVLPASYCPPGDGYCDPSGGYGGDDAAYANFGGYSMPDQCGPHYFDVSTGALFLQGDGLFKGTPPLGSIGVNGDRILDPDSTFDDYEPGWFIAARLDFGPLSVLEATYFGLYDIGFHDTIRSVDVAPGGVDFQLNSVFSDYGVIPIDGLDEGSVYDFDYQADLQSTEFSYRRYWLGYSPRISGTYLAGFRYLRLAETMSLNTIALNGTGSLNWRDSNDLLGFQVGGDGWIALRQGLRFGGEIKSGIYNNRFEFNRSVALPGTSNDSNVSVDGNQIAFAAEGSLDLVADILPSWSIRGGYRALYMNSLATVGTNVPVVLSSPDVGTQADALFHGFQATVEYIW